MGEEVREREKNISSGEEKAGEAQVRNQMIL